MVPKMVVIPLFRNLYPHLLETPHSYNIEFKKVTIYGLNNNI